ncbi:MAG: peptidoglycan-associated lipoprotein Pal [Pseudomonadales bacterium]
MNLMKRSFLLAAMLTLLAACGGSQPIVDETSSSDQAGSADTMGTGADSEFDRDGSNSDGAFGAGLQTVFYFDYDRSTLTYETRQALDRHAENLRNSARVVRLEGHADDRGTREYNLALGERRAKSIADYLVLQGVSRSQLETISYGEEKPIAFSQDEDSYRMNRRVELK